MSQSLLAHQNFYLVGIKGVAMTSIAQCLADAGKEVRGSDVAETFVTQPILDQLAIEIDYSFEKELPKETACVIYTAAHQGADNPQVQQAKKRGLATFSQAEALAELFNHKQGIAVCGVGGKSTTSAMITWILEEYGRDNPQFSPSYSVGVGEIIGLNRSGHWRQKSELFVTEADEYVVDPAAPDKGEEITPRFSFLKPETLICTSLSYDHPDVYRDFSHTKQVFAEFFKQIKPNGTLIYHQDNSDLKALVKKLLPVFEEKNITTVSYGTTGTATFQYANLENTALGGTADLKFGTKKYQLKLNLPGLYNLKNAIAALAACYQHGVPIEASLQALAEFKSTKRRFEKVGVKNGVTYYDDYAHHPREIAAVMESLQAAYPKQRVVVAFQPHTYSRTKELFSDFVQALALAPELVVMDIFASARESQDPTVSSKKLIETIKSDFPQQKVAHTPNLNDLAEYCRKLPEDTVVITLGAGDIYKVHQMV